MHRTERERSTKNIVILSEAEADQRAERSRLERVLNFGGTGMGYAEGVALRIHTQGSEHALGSFLSLRMTRLVLRRWRSE